ncbi:CdaR family transcriptional regulator [Alkalicoccobacillus porphyridii]|uniref:Carbohydrate diacid regulator n=1 Tax=Alkalicoccobacillus porphyridii TaxID=2597270 RepID=A0A554A4D1_9BACI|nr:sugar diacid recognition domain-containing protein [Alkalicoccobacillus porphyridii]TSB48547.1 carbohydrate diacid regulator [Alkalicoccobacillus porphyridii]
MLSHSLAKKIIDDVETYINEEIIITGTDGIILASSDHSRIGNLHEGSLICIQKRNMLIIHKNDEKTLKGVKNGINLPIFFDEQLIGVVGVTGNPDDVLAYGKLLRKMTELLIKENYYSKQAQWRLRNLETFVDDWIEANEITQELMDRAFVYQIDLSQTKQIILIEGMFSYDSVHNISDYWDDERHVDFFIYHGHSQLLLVHSVYTDETILSQKLKKLCTYTNAKIGVGQAVSPELVSRSYSQAKKALNASSINNPIVFEKDLQLSLCLQEINSEVKKEYIKRVLSQVMKEETLLHTVRIFLQQNMAIKGTAEALNIHINTLHYRLKRWHQLTNLDLKKTDSIVSTYLAFFFLDEHTN